MQESLGVVWKGVSQKRIYKAQWLTAWAPRSQKELTQTETLKVIKKDSKQKDIMVQSA